LKISVFSFFRKHNVFFEISESLLESPNQERSNGGTFVARSYPVMKLCSFGNGPMHKYDDPLT